MPLGHGLGLYTEGRDLCPSPRQLYNSLIAKSLSNLHYRVSRESIKKAPRTGLKRSKGYSTILCY